MALASVPAEVVTRILASCDTASQLGALVSTCRRVHEIWLENAPGIIWTVCSRDIPCFDEALMVVRATDVVAKSEAQGKLPPMPGDFPISSLSGRTSLPTLAEVKAVSNLRHLAHALDVAFCHYRHGGGRKYVDMSVNWPGGRESWPPEVPPEEPDRMPEWREGVHRGIYRLLLAGAALSGLYNEPFFKVKEEQANERSSAALANLGNSCVLSAAEMEYLDRFAAYNMTAPAAAEEAAFGALGSWLIDDILAKDGRESHADLFANGTGRATLCQGSECPVLGVDGGLSHADAHLAVLSIARMLWLSVRIQSAVSRHYTPLDASEFDAPPPSWDPQSYDEAQEAGRAASMKVPVVFFGVFQAEAVSVPHSVVLQDKPFLQVSPLRHDGEAREFPPTFTHNAGMHIRQTLRWIQFNSGRPNCSSYSEIPPSMMLKFFEYLFRKHFELQFDAMAFTDLYGEEEMPFLLFLESFKLFALEDGDQRGDGCLEDGFELLAPYNPLPRLLFREDLRDEWWF